MDTINLPSLQYAFKLSATVIFEVGYDRCGNNPRKRFTTHSSKFNQPKSDWKQCGQSQESLLPRFPAAYNFYKKWDKLHLQDLCNQEYTELLSDLNTLVTKYPIHLSRASDDSFRFSELKELSMFKK